MKTRSLPRLRPTRALLAIALAALTSFVAPAEAATPTAAALPSPLDPGIWQKRAPTGLARQEVSYTRVGQRFYLAFGGTAQQRYNPLTDTWKYVHDTPAALNHIAGVEVGGKIYYIGGLTLTHPPVEVGSVYIYDPVADSFSTGASMPAGRERGAGGVVVYNGRIFYAGGLHGGLSADELDRYNPVTDRWTTMPSMPVARDHSAAALVGDRMYMIGGRDDGVTITENDAFDFSTGTWVTGLAPLPTPRAGFASAVIGNEILVIGGEYPPNVEGAVEAYDTVTDTWRTLTPMLTPRHGIQAVVWRGGIYIADGGAVAGGGQNTDVHEVLFPTSARPDELIKLSGDASFLGSNTYDAAPGPTRSTSGAIGAASQFLVQVQNDASVADRIRVTGPAGTSDFTVQYQWNGGDVTSQVTGAGLLLPKLQPGATTAVSIFVTPQSSGVSDTWTVAASSNRVPAIDDHVSASVSVP